MRISLTQQDSMKKWCEMNDVINDIIKAWTAFDRDRYL